MMFAWIQQHPVAPTQTQIIRTQKTKAAEIDAALVKAWPNISPSVAWSVDVAQNALVVSGTEEEIAGVKQFIALLEEPSAGLLKVRYIVKRIHIPHELTQGVDWTDARNIIVGPGSEPSLCRYASIYESKKVDAILALPAE